MAIHAQPDDPRPVMRYADALADACRDFSTLELCLVWRQSFALSRRAQKAEDKLRLIRLRQAFLDEFQRRDPEALQAWLSSPVSPELAPIAYFKPRMPHESV